MRILVTGGEGQIASALSLLDIDNEMLFISKRECDITQADMVKLICADYKPQFLINCAAYTNVDKAETEKAQAFDVNTLGVEVLATHCQEAGIPLLQLSTDYIFSGEKKIPYVENDEAHPLNIYGESKWKGEIACRHFCSQHIILRVSGVFGLQGNNFIKAILRAAQEKEVLQVVSDQITCPTSAKSIAEACLRIIQHIIAKPHFSAWGTYHFASQEALSWFDFAKKILGDSKSIEPISSAQSNRPAKRPAYSVLNCQKIKTVFGIEQPSLNAELSFFLKEFLS